MEKKTTITKELISPRSIAVIGGSDDLYKPGGRVLENLRTHGFKGALMVVNPKCDEVQGVRSYHRVEDLPQVDLAVMAIAAKHCPHAVEVLAREKGTKAFVILSAGFHEEGEEGAKLEREIVDTVNAHGACLIGPNCVGMMNANHTSVFIRPIPKLDSKGVDFITGSGATAVFIIELGITQGLSFSSVFSVGNSAQLGVEDVLEYLDESYDPGETPLRGESHESPKVANARPLLGTQRLPHRGDKGRDIRGGKPRGKLPHRCPRKQRCGGGRPF